MTNEQAQKVVDMQEAALKNFKQSQEEQLEQFKTDWYKESKNDQEVGGESFGENVELAKRVLEKYATDSFRENLDKTGYGNHPELLRTFVRIGKAMGNDKMVHPGAQTSKPERSLEDIFYSNNNN